MFTKLVNERAGGKLKINFIQGEQLGNDVQVIEQMMKGSVHLYGDVLDWYANWVKDFSIFAWGFTFRDNDHWQKFLDSDTFRPYGRGASDASRACASSPARRRSRGCCSPRSRSTRRTTSQDVKMRVPEIKTYLNLWSTLGTQPSRVAWARGLPRPEDRRHRRDRGADLSRPTPPSSTTPRPT